MAANPAPGHIDCNEYYGESGSISGASQCAHDNGTWQAGMTCAEALPGKVNVGCAFNPGTQACVINYYPCLQSCTTCTVSSSTCVAP